MVDPVKGSTEVDVNNPCLVPPLQCTQRPYEWGVDPTGCHGLSTRGAYTHAEEFDSLTDCSLTKGLLTHSRIVDSLTDCSLTKGLLTHSRIVN